MLVERLQEFNRFKIFTSAVFICNPFAVLAVIVKVEHWSNCVNSYAVKMKFLEPKCCTRHKEWANFISAEVKHSCSPAVMLALSRVWVFIKRRAVKFIKSVLILWKMCRYPVKNNADTRFMTFVNKIHQILGRAVAWGCGKIARYLIAPASVIRIFRKRHKLNVGISHLFNIRDKLVRQIPVRIEIAVLVLLPRACVHLVYVYRRGINVWGIAFFNPLIVLPLMAALDFIEFWGSTGSCLGMKSIRVAFKDDFSRPCGYGKFVRVKLLYAVNNTFPNAARFRKHSHRCCLYVPIVKIAY